MTGLHIGLSLVSVGGPRFSPLSLFASGEDGGWYDPSDTATVFSNSGATTAARSTESVKAITDKSGCGSTAVISSSDSTCRWQTETTAGRRYIRQSMRADALRLTATFGTSLGASCTVVFANRSTVEFRTSQTIGTTYEIPKSFFALLIINRALTAQETTDLRAYFSTYCPAYASTYDMYASASGNDANDGLSAGSPKTLAGAFAAICDLTGVKRLAVLAGTYTAPELSTLVEAGFATTLHMHFPTGAVIFDGGETPTTAGTGLSAFDFGSSPPVKVWGDGNFKVTGYGNNAAGSSGSATGELYDAWITNAADGLTAHATSTLRAYGCTLDEHMKGAFNHTGTSVGSRSTTYHEDCVFYAKHGSTFGIGSYADSSSDATFVQCDFLPDPGTTDRGKFNFTASNATGTGVFTRCRFGAPHLAAGTNSSLTTLASATLTECYVNRFWFQPQSGAQTVTFTRCFGPRVTIRPRYTVTNVMNIDNCAFTAGFDGNLLYSASVYSSPTDIGGSGRVRNSILNGATVAISKHASNTDLNGNWSFLNNCLNGNTTDYASGLTADGTDLASAPSLVAPTTDVPADWCLGGASPCIGAGVGGANISFTAAELSA